MIWKFLKQNVLSPKGLNWVQHLASRTGLSRKALLGRRLAASRLREAARWQLLWNNVLVHGKLKLLNFLVDFVLMLYSILITDWVLL